LWLGSQWRISFDRLSSLQVALQVPAAATGGRFDTDKGPDYLYRDYAANGLIPPDTTTALKDFSLRESMRRALNCLNLLLVDGSAADTQTARGQLLVHYSRRGAPHPTGSNSGVVKR
jgi:hypothetical protein